MIGIESKAGSHRVFPILRSLLLLILVSLFGAQVVAAAPAAVAPAADPAINRPYENPDVDYWRGVFESDRREIYRHRHDILEALELRPGMAVADVGAGTGFFSLMFADAVGPQGKVYALDISDEFIEAIRDRAGELGLTNLSAVVNTQTSLSLPADSVDLVFISDTYHHFEYPREMLAGIHAALRPGGSVVIVDFRRQPGRSSPWVMGHVRAGASQVIRELGEAGFRHTATLDFMQTQYFLRFEKPGADDAGPKVK